jgi:hypothetical protein
MWIKATVLAIALLLPTLLNAQELPKATKFTDVSWHTITHVVYESGQRNAALKIIREHFVPAADAAGLERPQLFEHQTGEWDITLIWSMPEGPAGMEWEVNPWQESWWASFAEREGGMEAGMAIWQDYIGKVSQASTSVVIDRGM